MLRLLLRLPEPFLVKPVTNTTKKTASEEKHLEIALSVATRETKLKNVAPPAPPQLRLPFPSFALARGPWTDDAGGGGRPASAVTVGATKHRKMEKVEASADGRPAVGGGGGPRAPRRRRSKEVARRAAR